MLTISRLVKPNCIKVANTNLVINSAEEIIMDAEILGFNNFNLSISNLSGSPITSVNIYASANQINYYVVETAALNNIDPDLTESYMFNLVNRFIRITTIGSGISTISAYLVGET